MSCPKCPRRRGCGGYIPKSERCTTESHWSVCGLRSRIMRKLRAFKVVYARVVAERQNHEPIPTLLAE